MQVRRLATSGSTRSESAHSVQACTQVKQASIAAARSRVPIRSGAGAASSISRVLVMLIDNRVGGVEQQDLALKRSAFAIARPMVAASERSRAIAWSGRMPDARLRPLHGQTTVHQRGEVDVVDGSEPRTASVRDLRVVKGRAFSSQLAGA